MSEQDKNPLGDWEIKRVDPKRIELKLPEGMKIDGEEPLSIEDVKDAIEAYERQTPIGPKCCRRRVMIA